MKVPEGWRQVTIGDLASFVGSGITPRGGRSVYKADGVLFIRSQNVHFGGLRLDDVAYIEPALHEQMGRTHVRPLDVLLNITGASIGRCATVPESFRPANVNQHVCIIRCVQGYADGRYIAQYLASPMGQEEIRLRQAGLSREALNYEQVRALRLLLPPFDEQKKIAAILSSVDEAIEATQVVIDQLQVVKKAMMGELLTKGTPGRHSRFKKTEIGEVPEGWGVVDVLDTVEKVRPAGSVQRNAYKRSGKYPVVDQGAEFIAGYTDEDDLVVDTKEPIILFGDHTREWKYLDFPFVCGADGTQLLRAKPGINPRFLYFALAALPLKNLGYARHFKLLREAKVALPPREEQDEIARAISGVVEREHVERAKVEQLKELKSALLSALLTGEVRVR